MSEEKRNDALGGANDESPKKELLIVDDDESYLKLIKKWMSEAHKATAVKSGIQALKYLEGHRPDLVLLDYEMPELNGGDVLQKMRGHRICPCDRERRDRDGHALRVYEKPACTCDDLPLRRRQISWIFF